MPYFIFEVSVPLRLTYIDAKEKYKDARDTVRRLREQAQSPDAVQRYRMVFAGNQAEAEKLLSKPRDERVIGED